jgi:hypothetical protein
MDFGEIRSVSLHVSLQPVVCLEYISVMLLTNMMFHAFQEGFIQ